MSHLRGFAASLPECECDQDRPYVHPRVLLGVIPIGRLNEATSVNTGAFWEAFQSQARQTAAAEEP